MDDFDDSNAASCIIGIFELSSGDKSVALKYLNRFLELPRNDEMWDYVRSQAEGVIRKFEAAQTEQSPTPKESDPPQEKAYPTTKKPTEQKPEPSTPVEEPASSTWWPVVVVVVAAAFGLLWVLLKKRK